MIINISSWKSPHPPPVQSSPAPPNFPLPVSVLEISQPAQPLPSLNPPVSVLEISSCCNKISPPQTGYWVVLGLLYLHKYFNIYRNKFKQNIQIMIGTESNHYYTNIWNIFQNVQNTIMNDTREHSLLMNIIDNNSAIFSKIQYD